MSVLDILSVTCNKCKAKIPNINEENIVTFFDEVTYDERLAGHICTSCLTIAAVAEMKQFESEEYLCCERRGCIQCDPMEFDPQLNGSYDENEANKC